MIVRFTPAARSQFRIALDYIAADDHRAALVFRRRVETRLRRLERFPASGRRIPEFPDLPHREVVVPPYRFFYRAKDGVVWVVAVWHAARLARPPVS